MPCGVGVVFPSMLSTSVCHSYKLGSVHVIASPSCDHHARWFRGIRLEAMTAVRWMLATSLCRCRTLRNWRVPSSFSNESTQPRFPTTAGTMSTLYPGYCAARSPFSPRYFARFSAARSSTRRSFVTATSTM